MLQIKSFIDKLNMVINVDHFDLEEEKDLKNFEEISYFFLLVDVFVGVVKISPFTRFET